MTSRADASTGRWMHHGDEVHTGQVACGLNFPTSLGFDDEGALWIAESGLPFGGAPPGGRVLRGTTVIADGLRAPVNGLLWHEGGWIISEGGRPGRLSRLEVGGARTTLLDDLPGFGDYQTSMAVRGPDGKLYFGQGASTNMGVVGLDSYDIGWLKQLPREADLPGLDIVVSDATFETADPREPGKQALTGVFTPFGTLGGERRIAGRMPCTAAVLRCNPDGTELELFAWGLRNAFGLLFLPDGRLLATDQGADERGSRPVGNAPDLLYDVKPGYWYGFPDFVGGTPVSDPRFRPSRGAAPQPVLLNHAELPPLAKPLFEFPVNSSATKLDLIPADAPRYGGQLLVCLFGDERPLTGPPGRKAGRALARLDLADGSLHRIDLGPLHRPIDVRVHDGSVYVLDFGEFEMAPGRVDAVAGSGAVHRFPLSAL
jgi:glucose/arabinose dehydrogenase